LAGAFFVTRAKRNLDASRIYSQQVDKQAGIIADQSVALNGYASRKDYPSHLRRIRFHDLENGKDLVFLTNPFTLPAATIRTLYKKSRWQVELFFKWIKQRLRIKVFFGTSENAVKTQIWIAVSVYLLVAIVKKKVASPLGNIVRDNAHFEGTSAEELHKSANCRSKTTDSVRLLTGQQ
jgi:hypothetical protein